MDHAAMPEPRDPSNKPAAPNAEDPADEAKKTAQAEASLDLIAAVMAKAHGEAQGKAGRELQAHVADIVSQVKTVANIAAAQNQAETERQQAAAELERLLDT